MLRFHCLGVQDSGLGLGFRGLGIRYSFRVYGLGVQDSGLGLGSRRLKGLGQGVRVYGFRSRALRLERPQGDDGGYRAHGNIWGMISLNDEYVGIVV